MKLPRKECPCCHKDVAVYDTRRDGWKRVPCKPWFAGHKCPHKHDCFPDNKSLNSCTECRAVKKSSKKSGKQMLKELPINHLTPAKQRDLLLELVECFRDSFEHGSADDCYREAVSTFEKYDIDVQPV